MALDVSEIYQPQIHWSLEHLEIPVVFRQSEHDELCSAVCVFITLVNI